MIITKDLCEEFANFLLTVQARRLERNMVILLLSWLKQQELKGWPDDMEGLLADMTAFFDLMHVIEKEIAPFGQD